MHIGNINEHCSGRRTPIITQGRRSPSSGSRVRTLVIGKSLYNVAAWTLSSSVALVTHRSHNVCSPSTQAPQYV